MSLRRSSVEYAYFYLMGKCRVCAISHRELKGLMEREIEREWMRERESIKRRTYSNLRPNCDESNNNMGASRSNNNYFLNIIVQSWYTRMSDLSDVY